MQVGCEASISYRQTSLIPRIADFNSRGRAARRRGWSSRECSSGDRRRPSGPSFPSTTRQEWRLRESRAGRWKEKTERRDLQVGSGPPAGERPDTRVLPAFFSPVPSCGAPSRGARCLDLHGRRTCLSLSPADVQPLRPFLTQSLIHRGDALMRADQSTNETLPWLAINALNDGRAIEPSTGCCSYSCTSSKTDQSTSRKCNRGEGSGLWLCDGMTSETLPGCRDVWSHRVSRLVDKSKLSFNRS